MLIPKLTALSEFGAATRLEPGESPNSVTGEGYMENVQGVLELLSEVREDLTRSANSSAVERVDEAIGLLEAYEEDQQDGPSISDVLEKVGDILCAAGPIASLVNTIIQSLR